MPKVDQFSRAELLLSTVRLTLAQHGESNGSATWRCQCGTECDNRIGLRAHVAGKLWEHWTATSALDAAAPDLLAACEAAIVNAHANIDARRKWTARDQATYDKLEAAIAQAREG